MAVAVRAQTGSPGKGCGKAAAWKTKNRFSTALGNPAKRRGIPTFPQPRRRSIDHEPDISCATKTGHFNLLTTQRKLGLQKLERQFTGERDLRLSRVTLADLSDAVEFFAAALQFGFESAMIFQRHN